MNIRFQSSLLHLHILECMLKFLHYLHKEFVCKPIESNPRWASILSLQFPLLCLLIVRLSTPMAAHQILFYDLMDDDHPMTHIEFIMPHMVGVCTSK